MVDHISRLEAVRSRSSRAPMPVVVEAGGDHVPSALEPPGDGAGEAYEEQWHELMKSPEADSTITS